MFDDVECSALSCPLCGSRIDWQSKDGPCTLERLTIHELMQGANSPEVYGSCNECRIWVEVHVRRQLPPRTPAQEAQYQKDQEAIQARYNPGC